MKKQVIFDPIVNPKAVVSSGKARFSILTDRIIRMEFDPAANFDDRPSLVYWYRNFDAPEFHVSSSDDQIIIETEFLRLHFNEKNRFHRRDLWIELEETGQLWRYGDTDQLNLGGTTRTLDGAVGAVELDPGLVSRSGWALVDDSQSLVFDEHNWPTPRNKPTTYKDLYFYGYGQNYLYAITDHQRLTGKPGLLPRWALGNWWSRYWAYSDRSLVALMDEFKKQNIPLSVCIVDMDWHITETGNQSSGWTGYTWNKKLFPEPEQFIQQLHQRNLKTALNLHPAEGVHPHEDVYSTMATRIGVNPDSLEPVSFDIADQIFAKAYFEILHHPLEKQGVDFWWIDWQQGNLSLIKGLDPLFWLNHLHYYDQGKTTDKRPFIFSRWPGLGGHRYPIGFSGDTVVHWDSLAFQPHMTATAANVAFGWWSHDIGGHYGGIEDAELYLRWVQFGVFSPIFRLHSTNNPFIDRTPWGFDLNTLEYARQAMQLRHRLIPLLYTANYRNASTGEPVILPMYYRWKDEAAYQCPGQYTFCQDLLVAPVTSPIDPDTGFARKLVWLPEGDWFDLNTNEIFKGGFWYIIYAPLDRTPVFAPAGSIIPLNGDEPRNGVDLPSKFHVKVFPGKDSSYSIYEDAGEGQSYLDGDYCFTKISTHWDNKNLHIIVDAADGTFASFLPTKRSWQFEIVGINQPTEIKSPHVECDWVYSLETHTLLINCEPFPSDQSLELYVEGITFDAVSSTPFDRINRLLLKMRLPTMVKQEFQNQIPELMINPTKFFSMAHNFTKYQLLAIYESVFPASEEKPAEDASYAFERMMEKLRKIK